MIQPMLHICTCGRQASQRHHKFPQHKHNREKYGSLIDKRFNIEMMCPQCHSSHANIEKLWDEKKFLIELNKYVKELEIKSRSFQ